MVEKKKKALSEFFGKWPGPKEELDKLEKDIKEMRKRAKSVTVF